MPSGGSRGASISILLTERTIDALRSCINHKVPVMSEHSKSCDFGKIYLAKYRALNLMNVDIHFILLDEMRSVCDFVEVAVWYKTRV